jgi:hypothetical protein
MLDFKDEEFDEISYVLSVYDLSQLKTKEAKVYQRQVAKLVPGIKDPTDEMIIEVLYENYENTACGKVLRKFDQLGEQGLIDIGPGGKIIMNFSH